jgi:hypothetical protein
VSPSEPPAEVRSEMGIPSRTPKHLAREVIKAAGIICDINPIIDFLSFGGIPCSTRIEAHPRFFVKPFMGVQIMQYIVRPPIPRPSRTAKLHVAYHFTVRRGVSVYVNPMSDSPVRGLLDGVSVTVAMNEDEYPRSRLPEKHDWVISESELNKEDALRIVQYITLGLVGFAQSAWLSYVLSRGALTDRYVVPLAQSPLDAQNVVDARVDNLHGTPVSVDQDQPFPVYGWLDIWWEPEGPRQKAE